MTTEELLSLRRNPPSTDGNAEGNEYETFRKSILRAAVTKIMRNCDSQGGFVKISPPPTTIADTAGICITKAMNRPLTGGTVEAAAKPWLIPAGKYIAAHRPQGQHPP